MREQKYKERNFMEKLFVLTLERWVSTDAFCLSIACNKSLNTTWIKIIIILLYFMFLEITYFN